jgi:hypothetical protein
MACGCKPAEVSVAASCRDTRSSGLSGQAKEGNFCNSKTEMQDDCCRPLDIVSSGCQDGCGSGPTKKTQDSVGCGTNIKVDDKCCAPNSADHECKNSCSSALEPLQVEDPEKPSCCNDKPFPCCEVSCLDRVALRACENEKRAVQLDEASKSKLECSLQLRCPLLTVANLQLPPDLVQAASAAEIKMEKHATTTLVPPLILTRLPWELSVASAALCWPSDNNLVVSFNNVRLLSGSAARSRRLFSLCHALLSTLTAQPVQVQVPLPQRRDLGRRRAATIPVRKRRAILA